MCIVWKIRQCRLGIDDFGNPAVASDAEVITAPSNADTEAPDAQRSSDQGEVTVTVMEDAEYYAHNLVGEETPLLHGHGKRNLKAGILKGLLGRLGI